MFLLAPLLVLGFWLASLYESDRFAHHSAIADARILDSDLGCLGAYGSPGSTGVGWLWQLLVTVLAAEGILLLWRWRQRRTPDPER